VITSFISHQIDAKTFDWRDSTITALPVRLWSERTILSDTGEPKIKCKPQIPQISQMTETKGFGIIRCKKCIRKQKCSWQGRYPFSSNQRNLRNLRFAFGIWDELTKPVCPGRKPRAAQGMLFATIDSGLPNRKPWPRSTPICWSFVNVNSSSTHSAMLSIFSRWAISFIISTKIHCF
jgi:hypothetical protein